MSGIEFAALTISVLALTINAALTISLVRAGRPARSGSPILDDTVTPSLTYPLNETADGQPLNVLLDGARSVREYQRGSRPTAEPTNLRADLDMLDVERQRQRATRDANLVNAVRRRDDSTCRYCGSEVRWGGRIGPAKGHLVQIGLPGSTSPDDYVVGCGRCGATAPLAEDRPPLRPVPVSPAVPPAYGDLVKQEIADRTARRDPARLAHPDLDEAASLGDRLPVVSASVHGLGVVDDEGDGDVGGQEHRDHSGVALELDAEPLVAHERAPHDDLQAREVLVGDCVGLVAVDQGSHNDSPSLDGSSSPSVGVGLVGEVPPDSPTGHNTTGQVAQ